jgi:hypothetical protein
MARTIMIQKALRLAFGLTAFSVCFKAHGNTGLDLERWSTLWAPIRSLLINEPYPNIRIEVAQIAKTTVVDPPVEDHNFDRYMAASFILSGDEFREKIVGIFENVKSKRWIRAGDLHGFSKTRVRIVHTTNKVLLELFVRKESSAIRFDGIWYKLEEPDVRRFLSDLFKLTKDVVEGQAEG